MQTPIHFDTRWNGNHGIGRFSAELQNRLPGIVPLPILGPKLSLIDPLAVTLALASRRTGCFLSPGFNPPLASPIPFVFTIHDLAHLHVPEESSRLRRLYYRVVVRPAASKAARILTVSEYSRAEILAWSGLPPEQVRVVGNGVSPVFRPRADPLAGREPFLLHVGRRAGNKNIRNLLRAFGASRASASLGLRFTGLPDARTLAWAAEAGVADRIAFAGDLSDNALLDLYQRCAAFVFPSVHEGFGLPVIEAMATGTPVVTSTTTSLPEVAGAGNAVLADPHDVEGLAAALDRVVEDQALRSELSARGLRRAADFTWENVCARVVEAMQLTA